MITWTAIVLLSGPDNSPYSPQFATRVLSLACLIPVDIYNEKLVNILL